MDCQAFLRTVDDRLDGVLPNGILRAALQHEQQCEACARRFAASQALSRELRHLPEPPPMRAGFAEQALRRARLANPAPEGLQPRRDAAFALAGALAAGVGMAAVLWWQPRDTGHGITVPAVQTVTLTEGQIESLRMRIDAPHELEQVRFSVELPEHVWLAEQPGIRAITWDGHLAAGENLLELPLMALAGATGTITARVVWGEREHRLQARVVSVAPAWTPAGETDDSTGHGT